MSFFKGYYVAGIRNRCKHKHRTPVAAIECRVKQLVRLPRSLFIPIFAVYRDTKGKRHVEQINDEND